MRQYLKRFFNWLFGRKRTDWDALPYGKPSSEGDDFLRDNSRS